MSESNKKVTPKPSSAPAPKTKGLVRGSDTNLGWVERGYPQLAHWRNLAIEWLKGEIGGLGNKLEALVAFLERYIIRQGLPTDPGTFLACNTVLPDFYGTTCPNSVDGIKNNNRIHDFLHFVLLKEFSEPDDDGRPVISPAFRNPVPRMSNVGLPKLDESVHSPLPYGYIDELRQMIAEGPHFCDWQWAQCATGREIGEVGFSAPDWFEVTEDQIDRNDSDCVWRLRKVSRNYRGGQVLEMWSPVRWVALLAKLILPLRTFQVRMLDSGEADTWRFEMGTWALDTNPLAQGSEQKPLQQGVFRRSKMLVDVDAVSTVLYINTNKTADIAKPTSEKGYVLPWVASGPQHQDVFYWLERLRDWQEKYNPIQRRTTWASLDNRHIPTKSEVQLAGYSDTCFLFRTPEGAANEHQLPVTKAVLNRSWFRLLQTLELRLARRGECHQNGEPIRFLPRPEEQSGGVTTLFPLHSLRVSLITALALEGKVPFSILQKLVGHSRLLMTLYYTKPSATHIRDVLLGAAERLEATKGASILNFLHDTEYDQLLQQAICNSVPSLAMAIPQHPATRNPAGWMPMHHGLCLVGGNTSEVEDNGSVGGCYNGGPIIGSASNSRHGPVPGGSRNCVRCRWFVTKEEHLPALGAHLQTLAYHFDEARNASLTHESALQELKKQKVDAEEAGEPFTQLNAYRQAERIWESAMKRFSDLAEDLVACWRLIERCKAAHAASHENGSQLVAVGSLSDVHIAFEETESELLQLSGVCENVEVYPDLDPGKAVFRRSQLLDAVLYRDDLRPVFMLLSEEEQLRLGNDFMRRLAHKMDPSNPVLGQRGVVRLMDAGTKLSEYFGIDLRTLLPTTIPARAVPSGHLTLSGDEQ